jgi:hypothetical protein
MSVFNPSVFTQGVVSSPWLTFDYNFTGMTSLSSNTVDANRFTFTRASTATYFNSAGVLTTAAINEPRFDFNPSTLAARGLLVEGARTNSIRNSQAGGAVAGTPGTLPTNWSGFIGGGLTREIVTTGTINGISYIDVRFSGTSSSASGCSFDFEAQTQIAASLGQTWSQSLYVAMIAGSVANLTNVRLFLRESDGGGVVLGSQFGASIAGTLAANFQRAVFTATTNQPTVAFIQPRFEITFNSGVAIDITLRIAAPQLEQGSFPSSYIPTTGAAATRAVDSAIVSNLASIGFNANEGTWYVEAEVDDTAGVVRALIDSGSSGTNRLGVFKLISPLNVINVFSVRDNDFVNTLTTNSAAVPAGIVKVAFSYSDSLLTSSTNGSAVSTDSAGLLPSLFTAVNLGRRMDNANLLFGYLRRLSYIPSRVSNSYLQTLTT